MAGPTIEIRSARPDEAPQVGSAIVAAFITDPLGRFLWPSTHEYLRCAPQTIPLLATTSVESSGALVSADLCGAAMWLPPGVEMDFETIGKAFRETVPPAHQDDVFGTFEQMSRWHPDEPHWYLPMIGVDPNAQGRGLGGALMRHAVQRCDEQGLVAYLESSNPRNISLYERHGFEVMGQIQVGAGPLLTPMLRRPR